MYVYILHGRVLHKKLIVAELINKFPIFCQKSNVQYRVHKIPLLNPIVAQSN